MVANEYEMRADFEQAMGESFSEFVCPPVPFVDASPLECCEVIWSVLGRNVTPTILATLSNTQLAAICNRFADYFETNLPTLHQIKSAIAQTLMRWPVDSFPE